MHANTLAKLGLMPTATDPQIAAALKSPEPGRLGQAWNTEIQETMRGDGVNWQTLNLLKLAEQLDAQPEDELT